MKPEDSAASGTRTALGAAYAAIDAALLARDVEPALAQLSPDFEHTYLDGTVILRREQEGLLRLQLAGNPAVGPAQTMIEALVETPTGVTATVRRTVMTGESFGEFALRDAWITRDGRWLLADREEIEAPVWGSAVPAEPAGSPRLARLGADLAAGDATALAAFWDEVAGHAPLIEPHEGDPALAQVTFLWRSAQEQRVTLVAGMPRRGADKAFRRLGESDVWSYTETMPVTGRFNYLLAVEGTLPHLGERKVTRELHDPLNGNPPHADSSWFELPDAPPQPYGAERPEVPRGTLVRTSLQGAALGEDRAYSVYLPAGYDPDAPDNRLLVLFDGEAYGAGPMVSVATPRIVDNLLADQMVPPLAVLLVHNPWDVRERDLPCSESFATFVARELVPEVQARYRAGLRPEHVVVAGSSYGGLAATYHALHHPDVFGSVLSLSGSFWHTDGWPPGSAKPYHGTLGLMQREYAASPRLPLRFWMTAGRFEGEIMTLTNRHMRSILEAKGYPVTYTEFEGNHTYAAWRGALADGLISLLGGETA